MNGSGRDRAGRPPGVVVVTVALALPTLLLVAGLSVDAGMLFLYRVQAYAAADLGALAGAQNVAWEALREGVRRLVPEAAKADARAWTLANLEETMPRAVRDGQVQITVDVHNPGEEGARDRVSGRRLADPTVCVEVRLPVSLWFVRMLVKEVWLSVHADASVVEENVGDAEPARHGGFPKHVEIPRTICR